MVVLKELKEFLNEPENQELLNNYKFKEIYEKLTGLGLVAIFTQLCLESKINPLDYMDEVPTFFMFSNTNIKSFTIPNNIKNIGVSAFEQCSNLTSINLPNNLTKISNSAFQYCLALNNVTIPDSVTDIENYAFYNCSDLSNIKLPDNLKTIGDSTFSSCSFESIILPNNVSTISKYAFGWCDNLKYIELPKNLKFIGNSCFYNCKNLKDIKYNGTKEEWKNKQIPKDWYYKIAKNCILHCTDGDIEL